MCKIVFVEDDSVDSDEIPISATSHQELDCLQMFSTDCATRINALSEKLLLQHYQCQTFFSNSCMFATYNIITFSITL